MRRRREGRRKKVIQIVLGLFIVFLMVFSIFELYVTNQGAQGALSYGTYRFDVDPDTRKYITTINKTKYDFYTFPSEAELINLTQGIGSLLGNAQAIVYSLDPGQQNLQFVEQARYELANAVGKPGDLAVTRNDSSYPGTPVYTCDDARQYMPVVLFNVSDNVSIVAQGSCIILNANESDFFRLRDRVLYTYLGIIS